jgi:pilus assembly protein CpaE
VVLLDLDLLGGDAALHLDAKPSGSLSNTLRDPHRLDQLLIERAVTRLSDRLNLLASQQDAA